MARSRIGWILPLFLLAACRTFDVEREQAFLRYRPNADALDVVLVYDGVGAAGSSDKDVAEAAEALQGIQRRGRHVLLYDWPFDFDLEQIVEQLGSQPPDEDSRGSEITRAFLDYESNIAVTEARFLTDEHGRLCLLQRLRIEHASAGLRLADRCANNEILEQHDDAEGRADETDPLVLERARRGGSWARFDGTTLEVSYPMTAEAAAKALASLTELRPDNPLPALLHSLSAIYATGDELRLRFAPAEDGWIAFEFRDPGRSYNGDVNKEIVVQLGAPAGSLAAGVSELKAKP